MQVSICKRITGLFLLIMICSLLTGCSEKKYDTDDVHAYVKETLGISDYSLKKDGGNQWSVDLTDGSDIEFRVIQGASDGLFGVSYYLADDYRYYATLYEMRDFAGAPSFDKETSADDDGLMMVSFSASYKDRESLEGLFDEADGFLKYMAESDHPVGLNLTFIFDHPLRNNVDAAYFADDADYNIFYIESLSSEKRKAAMDKMIIMCMDIGFDDLLADFSEAEIKSAVAGSTSCIGICRGNPDRDSYEYYDDLAGSIYRGQVSFPVIYELLVREGIETEGDSSHFSFTGPDGSLYEFFYDLDSEENPYYTKNGELQDNKTCYHIYRQWLSDICGLNVMVFNMDYQPNEGVYAEDGSLNRISIFYFEDEEMPYDRVREGYFNNITDHYRYLSYNQDEKLYMIPVDIGWTTDNQSYPVVWKEWAEYLGGEIETKASGHKYSTVWKLDGRRIEIDSEFNREIKELTFKVDGKKIDIDYYLSDSTYVGGTFMAAIRLDDFASLLSLSYVIDQESGSVIFRKDK